MHFVDRRVSCEAADSFSDSERPVLGRDPRPYEALPAVLAGSPIDRGWERFALSL
jgi:hypothetical protein